MSAPIASPVLIKDEMVPHSTSAASLFQRKDVVITVGGELVTEGVPTTSEVWVFLSPAGESAAPAFEKARSVEDLAQEHRRFLERMGNDFVDLE